jgi:hypothetical protein
MKIICSVSILFFIPFFLNAQISQVTIKGKVVDTTQVALPAATIMLLNKADSALVNYTTSNAEGFFTFRNVKNSGYLLKISFVSYMPLEMDIPQSNTKDLDIGTIKMQPMAEFLMEVVIRDAKAPIFIHGDTVEYDARTFKVPPGSTVEDLLRRLPGIDVDASGNISTMGKDVKTVYVDGKTFFGNDPTTVTQNLDAAAVSKVQVYNEKSEQERLTGISDGTKEKVLNLELKEEYKKGYFGKATIAGGTEQRWATRGNLNWFNDKQQLSFIGYGNNINQTSLNWSDYSEFKGQSMTTSYDNGDFGFGGIGGGRFISYSFYDYFDGSGFSENYGTGVNYNYFHKKVKFNTGYFYKKNDMFSDVFLNRQTFLTDSIFNKIDTLNDNSYRDNHNFSTRAEFEIDSFNIVILRAGVDFTNSGKVRNQTQLFQTSEYENINVDSLFNKNTQDYFTFNTLGIYRHKFKKKGRTFAISGAYDMAKNKNEELINNRNIIFDNLLNPLVVHVSNDKGENSQQIKSSMLYVEPLSKRFSVMGFYNFKNENRSNHNDSYIPDSNVEIDSLKLDYQNNVIYNRVGTSLNYGYEGINISLGGAFQSIIMEGISKTSENNNEQRFPYNNLMPYFSTDIEITDNISIDASYSYEMNEPSMSYLFPMPNLTNTKYITYGNPELDPERYHDISVGARYWNNASMMSIYLNASHESYDNSIVYNQEIEFNDSIGYITTYRPENVKGGNSSSIYMWSNFPIIKTKLTMNISPSFRVNNAPTFINGVENITNTKTYSGRTGFNLTVGPKLSFNINGNISSNYVEYSINSDRNQHYTNYSASAGIKWQFLKKTYLEGNYNFSNYNNKSLEFDQNIQLLNLSIRQVLGEKNRFEIRLAAFDLLNQQQYVRQYASLNYVEYRTAPTLARYFMLSVSYNLKGFDTDNRRF